MNKSILYSLIYVIFLMQIFVLSCISTCAETTTETFLSSIVPDLPEAIIGPCRTGGVLQELVLKTPKFRSRGNSFFIDQSSHKIAVFERAKVSDVVDENKEISVELFIELNDIPKETISKLLLPPRELVFVKDARAKYFIKIKDNANTELYEFDGLDSLGNDVDVSVKTIVNKLSTVKSNGQDFIVIDGRVKINFPLPPKKVLADGTKIDVFGESPSVIECKFKHTPVHDIDLVDISTAYDEGLAAAIIKEATGSD